MAKADNQQGVRSKDRERGVSSEHAHRMETDSTYRDVALTPPGTKRHWNSEEHTAENPSPND